MVSRSPCICVNDCYLCIYSLFKSVSSHRLFFFFNTFFHASHPSACFFFSSFVANLLKRIRFTLHACFAVSFFEIKIILPLFSTSCNDCSAPKVTRQLFYQGSDLIKTPPFSFIHFRNSVDDVIVNWFFIYFHYLHPHCIADVTCKQWNYFFY